MWYETLAIVVHFFTAPNYQKDNSPNLKDNCWYLSRFKVSTFGKIMRNMAAAQRHL